MSDPRLMLFLALGVVGAVYLTAWRRAWALAKEAGEIGWPTPTELGIGFGTNFFDTLGIGSYAPTTSLFRLLRLVPDERIPGTLTVGHALATITQSFIFIAIVAVDFSTLLTLILAAVAGAWLGAGVVAGMERRQVQLWMGGALLAAGTLFLLANLGAFSAGGTALGLSGGRFAIGVAGSLVLGAFMTVGVGFYAPCLIMISLLGMNPTASFPIMMGACAFLMPVASLRFLRAGAYSPRPALGLAIGGVPAVLLAASIVNSLPQPVVRWLVVVVVLYTAVGMLRSALAKGPQP